MKIDDLPSHILAKIEPEPNTGCWLWSASVFKTGYGQIRAAPRTRTAHRLVYELLVGPIPDGLQIDHLCKVRICCNPAHLEAVTQRVNILRSNSWSGRKARQTACIRGHSFDEQNTGRAPNGSRFCRTCRKAHDLARVRPSRAKSNAA